MGISQDPLSYNALAGILRQRIVTGLLKPGEQLPTRVQLQQEFATSTVTLQRALDALAGDGYVRSRARTGSFVVEHPPHLCRFALVFNQPVVTVHRASKFFGALLEAAWGLERTQPGCEIAVFESCTGHADDPVFSRLRNDVQRQRLAGVVFAFPPFSLLETEIVKSLGLPRVTLTEQPVGHMPAVSNHWRSFLDRGLDYLAQRGRRRVALIMSMHENSFDSSPVRRHFAQAVAQRRLESRPWWQVPAHYDVAASARQAARLLLRLPAGDRPDAILINDDHLVEAVAAGVLEENAADQVEMLGLANYPVLPNPVSPVTLLGFDAAELLTTALEVLRQQRRGLTPPASTAIPARFAHELPEHGGHQPPGIGRPLAVMNHLSTRNHT